MNEPLHRDVREAIAWTSENTEHYVFCSTDTVVRVHESSRSLYQLRKGEDGLHYWEPMVQAN